MLLGIITMAAALKKVTSEPFAHLSAAQALAGGVGAFLLAEVGFRRSLRIERGPWRVAAATLVLATITSGTEVPAVVELIALIVLLTGSFIIEQAVTKSKRQRRRTNSS